MPVELRSSNAYSFEELASTFTASYAGYLLPFVVDEPRMAFMVEAYDLDLTRSVVAVDGGRTVGLANLGRRRDRGWLGGIGVVPSHRGTGVGELLTSALIDQARASGARELALEVIVENAPAIALYDKLGFVRTRELEVLSFQSSDEPSPPPHEIDLDEAMRTVAASRTEPEPWQRHDDTIANLDGRPEGVRALAAAGALVVFRVANDAVDLLQAGGDPDGLRPLIATLRSLGKVTALNYPAGGLVATVLRDAGAEVRARQHEMVVAL